MTTSPKRGLAVVAAPALAVTLLAAAPAQADAPKITQDDFPTVAQVARVFPDLRKAQMETEKTRTTVYSASCTKTVAVRPKRAVTASYWSRKSKHVVQVTVSEHKSTKVAKKVLKGARTENACGFVDADGGAWFTKTKAPKLGNESVGRTLAVEEGAPPPVAHYIFRTKNRVIEMVVIGEKKPSLARSRRLAKIVYKRGL